jgi:hypothetical protein
MCAESRATFATKVYTLAFGATSYLCTWFDFNDTLYLDWTVDNPDAKEDPEMYELAYYLHEDLGPDLGKVEKLALCDGVNGNPWSQTPSEWRHWIIDIFGCLDAIKSVAVVDRAHDIEDSANLVEMNGIFAIDDELRIFKDMKEYSIEVEQEREIVDVDHMLGDDYIVPEIYTQALQLLPLSNTSWGRRVPREQPKEIPVLAHKTITTAKKRQEYLEAKRLYDIEKRLHGTKITLRSAEREPLTLAVRETMTLQEVIKRYRKARNVPPDRTYERATYTLGGDALCAKSTVFDLRIRSGAVLYISVHSSGRGMGSEAAALRARAQYTRQLEVAREFEFERMIEGDALHD